VGTAAPEVEASRRTTTGERAEERAQQQGSQEHGSQGGGGTTGVGAALAGAAIAALAAAGALQARRRAHGGDP
jgi:uncharacterized protein HemX